MGEERREKVATLYDDLLGLFELQWNRNGHQSVHFGYYDEAHTDPGSAMTNTTRKLAEAAGIEPGDRVLDVGCGAGGDAVWLARERGADVVGIDLVESQLERAQEHAVEEGVDDRVTLWRDDVHELLSVEDDEIDVAWALESLSHSTEPAVAARRLHDALVPGGRFVRGDVFLKTSEVTDAQRRLLQSIESDMGLRFEAISEYEATLEDVGFEAIEHWEVTPAIMPGADRSLDTSKLFGPLASAGSALGLGSDAAAQYFDFWSEVYELLASDCAGYYFLRARAGTDGASDGELDGEVEASDGEPDGEAEASDGTSDGEPENEATTDTGSSEN